MCTSGSSLRFWEIVPEFWTRVLWPLVDPLPKGLVVLFAVIYSRYLVVNWILKYFCLKESQIPGGYTRNITTKPSTARQTFTEHVRAQNVWTNRLKTAETFRLLRILQHCLISTWVQYTINVLALSTPWSWSYAVKYSNFCAKRLACMP